MSLPQQTRIRRLLAGNAFLGRMPAAILDMLVQRGQLRRYAKGDFIFRRGDASETMMLIVSGSIKLAVISAQAKEVVVTFGATGDVFGEIAALDGEDRAADAIALEESDVFVMHARDFVPALMQHPQAMIEIVHSLCRRARTRLALFEDLTLDMRARFARGLLRLARQVGRRRGDGIHLELTVSQEELGNYLGLARANVSRQLGRLKALGLVRSEGTRIIVTDEAGLARLAETAVAD